MPMLNMAGAALTCRLLPCMGRRGAWVQPHGPSYQVHLALLFGLLLFGFLLHGLQRLGHVFLQGCTGIRQLLAGELLELLGRTVSTLSGIMRMSVS